MSPEVAAIIASVMFILLVGLVAFFATEQHTVGSTTDENEWKENTRIENSDNTQEIMIED